MKGSWASGVGMVIEEMAPLKIEFRSEGARVHGTRSGEVRKRWPSANTIVCVLGNAPMSRGWWRGSPR